MKQHIAKILLSLLLVVASIIAIPKSVEAKSFPDTPTNYQKEINYLVEKEIIKGMPNGMFMPWNAVSKGEAIVMVARALNLDTTKQPTSFADVPATHYASGAVQSALQLGIIEYSDKFYPEQVITRGEMATMLVRAFQYSEMANDIYFFDVLEKNSLQEDIYKLVTAGIVTGYVDGTYKPTSTLTRTEFSILIVRALDESYRRYDRVLKKEPRIVTATSLNVRTGPGTGYSVLTKLSQNTEVSIYQVEGSWAKTIINGKVGYIHTDYIRKPMSDYKIAIDAGHGEDDPGAVANGLREKDINLAVSLIAQKELNNLGLEVFMTREDDTFYSLTERVNMSVASGADAFLSIHTNSATNAAATGTETYYSTASTQLTRAQKSERLAYYVQKRMLEAWGLKDRGVKKGTFLVIHKNPLPAALVELGFIVNSGDAAVLGNPVMQQRAGKAIADGIVDYFDWLSKAE